MNSTPVDRRTNQNQDGPFSPAPTDEQLQRLLYAAKGRNAHIYDVIRWVAENMAFTWETIDPATVPNAAAVGLLVFAKANPGDFWTTHFARLPFDDDTAPPNNEPSDSLWAIREQRVRNQSKDGT